MVSRTSFYAAPTAEVGCTFPKSFFPLRTVGFPYLYGNVFLIVALCLAASTVWVCIDKLPVCREG